MPPGSTRVVVTFIEENGGTRVVLSHYDLPTDQQRDHHRAGWQTYLDRLATRAAGGDPGPDPNTQAANDHPGLAENAGTGPATPQLRVQP